MVLANDSSGRQQNQRWPLPALQSELAALEAELASGKKPHVERLQALEGDVKHWAGWFSDGRPAPRFARILLRAGQPDAARRLLEYTHRVASDGDGSLSLLLVNATASCGDHASALKVLQPLVQAQPQNPALLGRAAELACKIGQVEDGLAFYARASSIDTAWRGRYLAALIAAERAEDALAEARAALRHTSGDTALCFASLRALWRFGNDRDEVARARSQFLAQIPPDDSAPLWRARMHKCAQDYEAALAELHVAHRNNPQDPSVLRERAEVALLLGHWGRDASAIAAAAPVCDQAPELAAQIARADRLLRAFGGSLASASEDPSRWSQLRSPESVFEIVAARRQPMLRPAGRGLVMIAHSLTAGGAERIVTNIFR
ncbi:MAG: hypothetical protein JO261_07915, partial [Alphaproteobacteria bacterium]|nr:hypothetical protein [Alphaproteobacteria bacterium]